MIFLARLIVGAINRVRLYTTLEVRDGIVHSFAWISHESFSIPS
jgi:hypothetical protein